MSTEPHVDARSLPPLPPRPRAPTQAAWDAMTPAEREAVVDALPTYIPREYLSTPPEGDDHVDAAVGTRDTLRMFYERTGRKLYVGAGVSVFYPNEDSFAPDVIAVEEVEPHNRTRWVVSAEGKGVDLALEVFIHGDRKKDLERNVRLYAGYGIREYFIFDRGRRRLLGYRLPSPGARMYEPIVPQGGRLPSRVLGFELKLEGARLRFYSGTARVLDQSEIILTLEESVEAAAVAREEEAERRAEAEARVKEEAERRAEAEARAKEEAERRAEAEARASEAERARVEVEAELAAALAEIERLRGAK